MSYHEENNDVRNTTDENYTDHDYFLQRYSSSFFMLEGVSRILGPEHPTVRLMRDAAESLDREKLEAAREAFFSLPEHVLKCVYHPWIGHPPPLGTRDKLRELLVPELEYEFENLECAYCYLQIDADKNNRVHPHCIVDEDGHVVEPTLVYDPRVPRWPVRVQIAEGSNPKIVKDLLRKILDKLDEDWDKLTDPDSYPGVFPVGIELSPW